jgi:hypothetical protein
LQNIYCEMLFLLFWFAFPSLWLKLSANVFQEQQILPSFSEERCAWERKSPSDSTPVYETNMWNTLDQSNSHRPQQAQSSQYYPILYLYEVQNLRRCF